MKNYPNRSSLWEDNAVVAVSADYNFGNLATVSDKNKSTKIIMLGVAVVLILASMVFLFLDDWFLSSPAPIYSSRSVLSYGDLVGSRSIGFRTDIVAAIFCLISVVLLVLSLFVNIKMVFGSFLVNILDVIVTIVFSLVGAANYSEFVPGHNTGGIYGYYIDSYYASFGYFSKYFYLFLLFMIASTVLCGICFRKSRKNRKNEE